MNKTISKAIRRSLGIAFRPFSHQRLNDEERAAYKDAKRRWNRIPRNERRITA